MQGSHNQDGGLRALSAAALLLALFGLVWLVAGPARAAHVDPKAGQAAAPPTGIAAAGDATSADAPPVTRPPSNRYALAGGCYALRSNANGRFVARTGNGYAASAGSAAQGERFRMQATALGSYLFYDRNEDFLAAGNGPSIVNAEQPSDDADWTITGGPGGYTARLPGNRGLAVTGGGALVQGGAHQFTFVRAGGCPLYPEVELNVDGRPTQGPTPYGDVLGYTDLHVHLMQFEAITGRFWCGRPWHRFGAPYALVDCPDHGPGGFGAVAESVLSGKPENHDTTGWPTFNDWPTHNSYTHQQLYYRWLERAYRSGLRIFLNLLNENEVLCRVYPYDQNPCNEMEGVRLQIPRMYELEDYVDAQHGGPGKGWFRIVTDPFEARRVINDGKLAVMIGVETSKLFDCDLHAPANTPSCDRAMIDRGMDELYDKGVRALYPIHKFDNAFGGVAFDSGPLGVAINASNFSQNGSFWDIERCPTQESDNPQISSPPGDVLLALKLFPTVVPTPVYPAPPHCNRFGLTALGEYMVRRMIDKQMLIDPDHMGVRARNRTLEIAKARGYSGVQSTHSWSTVESYPKIFKLGGFNNPISEGSRSFVRDWRTIKKLRDPRFAFGFGYGADVHGLHTTPGPRSGNSANPVRYPFTGVDPKVVLHRQRSGSQVYDVNVDGIPHYGLFPDWIEDMRKLAGPEIVRDFANGAEAYLETWERAVGIRTGCLAAKARVTRRGLGRVRLRVRAVPLLKRTLQPRQRPKRAYVYCVTGARNAKRKVVAAFTKSGRAALIASTAKRHRARKIGTGARARRVRRITRRYARGLRIRKLGRSRIVYGLRGGKVRFVAVATRRATNNKKKFRRYLKLAGL